MDSSTVESDSEYEAPQVIEVEELLGLLVPYGSV